MQPLEGDCVDTEYSCGCTTGRNLLNGAAFAVRCGRHNGRRPHDDMTPALAEQLAALSEELRICTRDHPEDERLGRAHANVRWLLGDRV